MLGRSIELELRTTKKHIFKLRDLGIHTIKDLLFYFPRSYDDKSSYTTISEIRTDQTNNLKGILTSIFNMKTKYGKKLTRAVFTDQTGSIEVVWFNQPHLVRMLPRDTEISLSGKAKFSFGKTSLVNPSYELLSSNSEQLHSGRLVPVYHETEGINSKWLRAKIKPIVDSFAKLVPEHLPENIISKHQLLPLSKAIQIIHFPKNEEQLQKAKFRLAFDELLLLQLKVLQKKWYWQNVSEEEKKFIKANSKHVEKCIDSLPFSLTNAQERVLQEIKDDLLEDFPMTRLVQGDVGAGKTIVAALSALRVVKSNYQVAIMAPTEILAKQHYANFLKVLKDFSLNIQFIAGSTTKKQKEEIIRQLKTGTVDIIIGTHALIQDGIGFKNLGLAIIDEQHRFGVKQRAILKNAGSPNLLTMTATPIPRTMAVTLYGDQDLSIIDELPAGRQTIITKLVPEKKRQDAYRWIEDQIKKGRQAFIICPLIDESDTIEVKSVLNEYAYLSEHIFPNLKLGLLHGKLKQEEKDQIMDDFKDNKINILVSTSVIEVGIDVPNASIMLIEGAERFGLSQLHQFRGRVGRGEHQSYCFLFTNKLSEEGRKRMKAMEKHSSGFKLSEIDLELRGPGEVYGIKQSGIPDLKMASLSDSKTIKLARESAEDILKKDPLLNSLPRIQEKITSSQVFLHD